MKFRGSKALNDRVENAPSDWDSWWRVRLDIYPRLRSFTDHSPGTLALRFFADGWASFLERESLVQNLPDQAAKPVGNHADRLIVPEAQPIASIENAI
jgi:hypothetical protein